MVLMILRIVFALSAGLAGITGAPIFGIGIIIPGIILFFTDGGWIPLLAYGVAGIALILFVGSFIF